MTFEKGKAVSERHDVISLVADSIYDEAQGRDVSFACFHHDLTAQNEQPLMNLQALSKLEDIPGEIVLGIREREKSHSLVAGDLRLSDAVE